MAQPTVQIGDYLLENWPKWTAEQRLEWLELFRHTFYDGPSTEDQAFTQAEMDKLNFQLGEAEKMAGYERRVGESRAVAVESLEKGDRIAEEFRRKTDLRAHIRLGEPLAPCVKERGN